LLNSLGVGWFGGRLFGWLAWRPTQVTVDLREEVVRISPVKMALFQVAIGRKLAKQYFLTLLEDQNFLLKPQDPTQVRKKAFSFHCFSILREKMWNWILKRSSKSL